MTCREENSIGEERREGQRLARRGRSEQSNAEKRREEERKEEKG